MTNNTHLIILDTETGGLNPGVESLLEIGIVVGDLKGQVKDTFEILIKPEQPVWTAAALGINDYLSRIANGGKKLGSLVNFYPESEAALRLMLWSTKLRKTHKHLHFLGHNIPFDTRFVDTWMSKMGYHGWSGMFGRRFRDSCDTANFLKDVGLINPEKCSLEELCKFFGIQHEGQHKALDDARATYKVYLEMMKLVKKRAGMI